MNGRFDYLLFGPFALFVLVLVVHVVEVLYDLEDVVLQPFTLVFLSHTETL